MFDDPRNVRKVLKDLRAKVDIYYNLSAKSGEETWDYLYWNMFSPFKV